MARGSIDEIITCIDKYLEESGEQTIGAVDANALLARKGILADNKDRKGRPLRDLLRSGKIPHAYQIGNTWYIPHSSQGNCKTMKSALPAKKSTPPRQTDKNNVRVSQKKQGLAPLIDSETNILILGSLPGDESIRRQQYYASKTNDFWKLVGLSLDIDLISLSYEEKTEQLLTRGIGLWDVFHRAERPGSADNSIDREQMNDFSQLRETAPKIKRVCFNGKMAGKYESVFKGLGYETVVLPSSSGANRSNQEKRQEAWRGALSSSSVE